MFFIDIALLVIRIIVLVDSGNQGDQLASSFYVWVAKDAISMVTLFIHLIYVCWSRSSEETHTDHYEVVINIEADKIKTRKSLREGKCVKFSYALSAFFVIGVVVGIGIGVHKAFLVWTKWSSLNGAEMKQLPSEKDFRKKERFKMKIL